MHRSHFGTIATLMLACLLAACSNDVTSAALAPTAASADRHNNLDATVQLVRQLAVQRGVVALQSPAPVRKSLVDLGQALAFDPILSGNKNISCMTCHMPAFATGDGRSLSVGEGAVDFGPKRTHPQGVFIPRNAPPAFNMAAMKHLFWDGRVQVDGHGGVSTPAGNQVTPAMQRVFEFGPISAIGMFPVTSRGEMRGLSGNELAAIDDANLTAIWAGLMNRLGTIPEYRAMFLAAYPGTRFEDMTFAHAANAIGGFLVDKLSFNDTPWDRFLAGNDHALTQAQLDGAQTFLTLKCSVCHTGATFSDDQFHNVAVAQFGPGQGDGLSGFDDFGRMRVTGLANDKYAFRTTPLRNVELTAPYGHDGAISSLRGFIEHYSESDVKLHAFDPNTLEPSLRGTLLNSADDVLATRDTLLKGVVLTPDLVDKLVAYMGALTDERAKHLDHLVPTHVPSNLSIIPRKP
jgi:cytochrome c peroxidase